MIFIYKNVIIRVKSLVVYATCIATVIIAHPDYILEWNWKKAVLLIALVWMALSNPPIDTFKERKE